MTAAVEARVLARAGWRGGLKKGDSANVKKYDLLLQCCGKGKALAEGKEIHEDIVRSGVKLDLRLGNRLIIMYNQCDDMADARRVFNKMSERNVISWTALIAGYARCGNSHNAVKLFGRMEQEGLKPD
eukprot:c39792_g1_i1 orf=1-381(-)